MKLTSVQLSLTDCRKLYAKCFSLCICVQDMEDVTVTHGPAHFNVSGWSSREPPTTNRRCLTPRFIHGNDKLMVQSQLVVCMQSSHEGDVMPRPLSFLGEGEAVLNNRITDESDLRAAGLWRGSGTAQKQAV